MGLEGLLVGLGEGMKSGVESYNQARDRKMKEKQYAQGLLKEGYQETEDGGLVMTSDAAEKLKFDQSQKNLTQEREALQHGLLTKKDPSGLITGFERDTSYQDPAKYKTKLEIEKLEREAGDSAFKKTTEGRIQNAPSEVKSKVGNVNSILNNISNYRNLVKSGESQSYLTPETPLIGGLVKSTPIDEIRAQIEENFGRLMSGGAIGQQEEKRFRQMIPTAADFRDPKVVERKLALLEDEMKIKLDAYAGEGRGASSALAKKDPVADGGSLDRRNQRMSKNSSIADPQKQHPQSNEALNWAKQNPKDPRAVEIMKRLGQ